MPCCPCIQAVLEACPNPRNGVYSAPAAKLAAVAQKAPGMVLQELRDMAAGSLIGFELSRDEGPAYEVSGCSLLRCSGGRYLCAARQSGGPC